MSTMRRLLTIAAIACAASSAQADIVTFSGATSTDRIYDRLLEDLSEVSLLGADVAYAAYTFKVDTSGTYLFLSTAAFDNFTFLYANGFAPLSPLQGVIAGNDDLITSTTSGFAAELMEGTTYTMVTTAFDSSQYGAFTNTIGGPGAVSAVPEPATVAFTLVGLGILGFQAHRRKARDPLQSH